MEINVDRFILRRRSFFSYLAQQDFDVLDKAEKKLFYIKRTLFSFRPPILIFHNDKKTLFLKIKPQVGFSASDPRIYFVFDEIGNVICKIKGKDFLFSSWDVVDTSSNKILATAQHEYKKEKKSWKFLWKNGFFENLSPSFGKQRRRRRVKSFLDCMYKDGS